MRRSILIALATLMPLSASAQLDIKLDGFLLQQGNGFVTNEAGFESLVGDLGQVLGPKMLGPASSTGALGFDVGFDIAATVVDAESAHWQSAVAEPSDVMTTLQLQFKKGLPFGFELGGAISHLVDSDLWGVAMNVKYAFLEGYRFLPVIGIRGWLGTALGTDQMTMLISGGDITVSKAIPIAGLLSLTPYAGYSLMYVRASSYIISFFPGDAPNPVNGILQNCDESGANCTGQFNVFRHRGFIGLRLVATHAAVAFEAMLADGIYTFTSTIGVDF